MSRITKIDLITKMIRDGANDTEILSEFPLMDPSELHRMMDREYEEMKKIQDNFFRKAGLN